MTWNINLTLSRSFGLQSEHGFQRFDLFFFMIVNMVGMLVKAKKSLGEWKTEEKVSQGRRWMEAKVYQLGELIEEFWRVMEEMEALVPGLKGI